MILFLGVTILFALSSLLIYTYYFKKGQFDQLEDTKYQLFHEDEE